MQNRQPGICAWASLETLGRTHGWDIMKGLTTTNREAPYERDVIDVLKTWEVKYTYEQSPETRWAYLVWYEPPTEHARVIKILETQKEAFNYIKTVKKEGDFWVEKTFYWNWDKLQELANRNLGVIVTLDYPPPPGKKPEEMRHMLILAGMDENEVRLIDSNRKPGHISHVPLHKFLSMWTGFMLVVEKP